MSLLPFTKATSALARSVSFVPVAAEDDALVVVHEARVQVIELIVGELFLPIADHVVVGTGRYAPRARALNTMFRPSSL